MPLLEGDEEEVNEEKGLKIFTLSKILTRLAVLLATNKSSKSFKQTKKRNQTNTLFCMDIIKSTKNFTTA